MLSRDSIESLAGERGLSYKEQAFLEVLLDIRDLLIKQAE